MRENNSISLALELVQLFCKTNPSPERPPKVYTRAYHRLIWRFWSELQTVRVATALRRSVFPVKVGEAPRRIETATAFCASRRLVARDQTRWKTKAHLGVAASIFHWQCGRRPVRPRPAERFAKARIRNRKPCDAERSSGLGLAPHRLDSFQAEWR